jgi:hypothetical protein
MVDPLGAALMQALLEQQNCPCPRRENIDLEPGAAVEDTHWLAGRDEEWRHVGATPARGRASNTSMNLCSRMQQGKLDKPMFAVDAETAECSTSPWSRPLYGSPSSSESEVDVESAGSAISTMSTLPPLGDISQSSKLERSEQQPPKDAKALLEGGTAAAEGTLRLHLREIQNKDPDLVIIVRKINLLGFNSPVILQNYFEQFCPVERVHVAHCHVKCQHSEKKRLRPGRLGFVVLTNKNDARSVLAKGNVQQINGSPIHVTAFQQQDADIADLA